MKSGKTIETAQRAMEILKELMHKEMRVDEILDMLCFNADYGVVYTKEAIYKYFNTFKVMGVEIKKNKSAYSVDKTFIKMNLSDEDKYVINLLESYVNSLYQSQYKENFDKIKNLISKNSCDLNSNITPLDFESLNKKYTSVADKIEKIEKACIKKETLIITYKISKDEIVKYTVVPDKIIFKKGFFFLYAFNKEGFEYSDFLIENILSFEFSPKYGETNFYVKHIVFKIKGDLVNNYRLKKNEYIQEQGDDYMIVVNKGQNLKELARRLFRYGDKCEMLYPSDCRSYVKDKVEQALAVYKD